MSAFGPEPPQTLPRVLTNISLFPGSGVGQNSFASVVLTGNGNLSGAAAQGTCSFGRDATQMSSTPAQFVAIYSMLPSGPSIGQPSLNGVLMPMVRSGSTFTAGPHGPNRCACAADGAQTMTVSAVTSSSVSFDLKSVNVFIVSYSSCWPGMIQASYLIKRKSGCETHHTGNVEKNGISLPELFIEPFPNRLLRIEPEELASRGVYVSDPGVGVGHDNAFLDRVEDRLDEAFFLRQPEQIIFNFLRPDAAEALDQLLEKTRFHALVVPGAVMRINPGG